MNLWTMDVALPAWVGLPDTPWTTFWVELLCWGLIAAAAYGLMRALVWLFTRRSATRIDDTLVRILRAPAVVLLLAWGLLSSWQAALGVTDATTWMTRLYRGIVIVLGAHVAWRVLYEVIIAHLRPTVAATDSQVDDIVVPVLSRIGPVVIIIAVANAVVTTFGGNLSALLASLGLLGLVLGYLFQEPLQGLFSGTYMALDSPFREDDLLILEDGTTCQVRKIGVRVTQLYDVQRHVLLFVPNAKLAANKIVNLTKPSVEFRTVLTVLLDRSIPCDEAAALLAEACNAHENVLGNWVDKAPAIRRRQAAYRVARERLQGVPQLGAPQERCCFDYQDQDARLEGELIRLQLEQALRERCEVFHGELLTAARALGAAEASGFTLAEAARARAELLRMMDLLDALVEQITVWLFLVRTIERELTDHSSESTIAQRVGRDLLQDGRLTLAELAACGVPGAPTRPIVVRGELGHIRSSEAEAQQAVDHRAFGDHGAYEDFLRLYAIWHRNITLVYRGLWQLYYQEHWEADPRHSPEARVRALAHHLADTFLVRVSHWQLPFAKLLGMTDAKWRFELAFLWMTWCGSISSAPDA